MGGPPLKGIHLRNDSSLRANDYNALKKMSPEVIRVMVGVNSKEALQAIKNDHPKALIIGRLFHPTKDISSAEFVRDISPKIREAVEVGITDFTIWNEPNLRSGDEGYGEGRDHATRFNQWFIDVYSALKDRYRSCTFFFPPLALLQNDMEWLDVCRPSIELADGLSVNVYWQNFKSEHKNHLDKTFGLRYQLYAEKYPDKVMDISEVGNSNSPDHSVDYNTVATEYTEWMREMDKWSAKSGTVVRSATFYILSSPDPTWEPFAWVTKTGGYRPMVDMLADYIEAGRAMYYPCLPWAGYKIDTTFLDENYYKEYKFWHTGVDINGKGGMNTDLGDNVHAVLGGIVVASGEYRSWGNIILIQHNHNGQVIWTQYAHLKDRLVQIGDAVQAGQVIGMIGLGGVNSTAAHLHFEVRSKPLPPNAWGMSKSEITNSYIEPIGFLVGSNQEA